jgi:ABC-2 type transport system permease protein
MSCWYIFKKEIMAYLNFPAIYIIIATFLVLSGHFFYTDLIYYNDFNITGTISVTAGLWQYYLNDLRFVFIFLLPLITMRTFAEEKKLGTMELISTYPVRDIDILLGKYFGCLGIFLGMLFLTFINVIIIGCIWNFTEIVPVFGGYLGIFLLGSALIASGIFISSLTENQIIAGFVTLGFFVFLWFLTWNEAAGSQAWIDVFRRISLFDRVINFFKGIINSKDIIFFLLFTCFFIFLTLCSLGSRRLREV